ncbi:MAG: hypothetical protein AB1861_16885 [Cyanobacteriota bacterium]
MAGNHTARQKGEKDLVETLLRLPKRNLESRIKELQKEIQERKKLRDESLSRLLTSQSRLKSLQTRAAYMGSMSESLKRQVDLLSNLGTLDRDISHEETGAFRDLSKLKAELQLAHEELAMEKEKLALLSSDEAKYSRTKNHNSNRKNERHRRSIEKTHTHA